MQKEITVKEIVDTLEQYTNIEEPIIIKRDNKDDVVILSMEEYRKKIFLAELDKKLDEAEDDIKNNRVHKARDVFKELREQYGY